jgi:hypothetical protein
MFEIDNKNQIEKQFISSQAFHQTAGGRVQKLTVGERFEPRILDSFDPVTQKQYWVFTCNNLNHTTKKNGQEKPSIIQVNTEKNAGAICEQGPRKSGSRDPRPKKSGSEGDPVTAAASGALALRRDRRLASALLTGAETGETGAEMIAVVPDSRAGDGKHTKKRGEAAKGITCQTKTLGATAKPAMAGCNRGEE